MVEEEIEHNNKLLNSSAFFSVLSTTEKQLVQSILNRRTFDKGAIVFSESQPASSIFILEKGSITLTIPGSHTIFVRQGDIFGEIAVINETARLGTAKVRSKSVVLELNTSALYNCLLYTSDAADE